MTGITLIYEDGLLARGVTRGDGTQGDVVTQNMRTIRSVPLRLRAGDGETIRNPHLQPLAAIRNEIEVRSEVFLPRESFEKINRELADEGEQTFVNPRNAASGTDVVLQLKSQYNDGTTHIVMSPLEFMQRLAALVPRPRLHLIRFHGVLAEFGCS